MFSCHSRVAVRAEGRRDQLQWLAGLVLFTILVMGAAIGHAEPVTSPQAPRPPLHSNGFAPTTPATTPGQSLVPPPQHAKGGVITPPTTVDTGIARSTPPATAFPTPVISPPSGVPK